jgi:hypothetical protein
MIQSEAFAETPVSREEQTILARFVRRASCVIAGAKSNETGKALAVSTFAML